MQPTTESFPPSGRLRCGRVVMLSSVIAFTANALLVRGLSGWPTVSSWLIASARFAIGLAVVATLARAGYPGGRLSLGALVRQPWLVARGMLGGAGVFFYYRAIQETGAGRATFISTTYIPLGAVLAALFLREPIRLRVVGALGLGVSGVALLTGFSFRSGLLNPGDRWAMLTALSSAVVIVLIRHLHRRETTSTIFGAQCWWGLALVAIPTAATWQSPDLFTSGLLLVAGLCSLTGQLAMTSAFRALPVAEGALIHLLVPFGIALGGWLCFRESYQPRELVGAGLILAGCSIAVIARPRLAATRSAVARS